MSTNDRYQEVQKECARNESNQTQRLRDKNVVVIGASRGLGRAIVAAVYAEGARVLAVARSAEPLKQLAAAFPGVRILALDATSEGAPTKVFETLAPDVLVVCAGAIPHMAPLVEQTWEQFSRNWNSLDHAAARQDDRDPHVQRRGCEWFAAFRRLCRSQAHADVSGALRAAGG